MRRSKFALAGLAGVLSLAVWGAGSAQANSIYVSDPATLNLGGGLTAYTYTIDLSPNGEVNSGTPTTPGGMLTISDGDMLTLYDIPGLQPGATATLFSHGSASWVVTEQLTGFQPDKAATGSNGFADQPNLLNVSVQYVGTGAGNYLAGESIKPTDLTPDPSSSGNYLLGTVSFVSTSPLGNRSVIGYGAEDFDNNLQQESANGTRVLGPEAVPLPAAFPAALVFGSMWLAKRRLFKKA